MYILLEYLPVFQRCLIKNVRMVFFDIDQGKTFKKVLPDAKLVLQGVMRSDMYQLGLDFLGKTGEDYQLYTFALV